MAAGPHYQFSLTLLQMDQRPPYNMGIPRPGMPPSSENMQGPPRQMQGYMDNMMFADPMQQMQQGMYQQRMPMSSGMQSHPQGLMAPEEDPRFVDDIMSALNPNDLENSMPDQSHMNQMPMYDQNVRSMPPPPQHQQHQQHQQQQQPMRTMGMAQSVPMSMPHPSMSSRLPQPPVNSQIVPTSTATTSQATKTTTSAPATNSSDEEGGDDVQKKKERRRQQVRYASRRRRKKQKDEETFLRDRIDELKEQIRIIGGDLTEQASQMAGMSEQALTDAYEKQMATVQSLRKDNNLLKEQLLQHENFARMIQYGLNALPSDCRDVDRKKIASMPMWFGDQMSALKGPTLVVDLNLCHEAVREAYNELKTFGPSVTSKTNVCYAMGWKTELWANDTCLSFRASRSISDKNIREVANASWEIITTPDKCKRIYPDVKQFRILQKVTDDIVVVHRIQSVASDLTDREFISVAFRVRDDNNYYIGLKTIQVQTECAENCLRAEECQGWMFTGESNDETSPWKAHFLGYYDVKGDKDDKMLNQLANEAMFGMLRWESEAMHPLSV